jgi:hypothetical protein
MAWYLVKYRDNFTFPVLDSGNSCCHPVQNLLIFHVLFEYVVDVFTRFACVLFLRVSSVFCFSLTEALRWVNSLYK